MRRIAAITKSALAGLLAAVLVSQATLAQTAPAVAGQEPAVAPYVPADADERGLIMQMDEAERRLKVSQFVIRDPETNAYVRQVLCRTVGEANCASVRIYIVRTPHFNAAMSPNGAMELWSGLLLRTRNEAQLAAVLGHEFAHYRERHSIKLFRDARSKSAAAVWLAFTGVGLIASISMLASLSRYSREMEQQADLGGLRDMARAGYDTREAAHVWEQMREEMDATALARNAKSKKDKSGGMFASHPPTTERVAYLASEAQQYPGTPGETGVDRYTHALAGLWPSIVEDQLKQNDFGASDYLLTSLAHDGWTPQLLYARGELYRRRGLGGDLEAAAGYYGQAIAQGASLPETWRGRGLALLKLNRPDEARTDLLEYERRAPNAPDKAMIAMMAGG